MRCSMLCLYTPVYRLPFTVYLCARLHEVVVVAQEMRSRLPKNCHVVDVIRILHDICVVLHRTPPRSRERSEDRYMVVHDVHAPPARRLCQRQLVSFHGIKPVNSSQFNPLGGIFPFLHLAIPQGIDCSQETPTPCRLHWNT